MSQTNQTMNESYRYPGSRPFTDSDLDRRLFFGRDRETQYLFHSVLVENLFVLYSKSGMGKSSLLNAGIMEPLREKGFFPMVIRFNQQGTAPLDDVYPAMAEAVMSRNRCAGAAGKVDYESGETETLWQFFKTASFWSADDEPLTPVIVFDQFEEFFTLNSPEHRKEFITQLSDLVRGRVPDSVQAAFKGKRFPYSERAPKVKIIISMREDYLGCLDEMAQAIPNILKNRFRLLPLNAEQAKEAIIKPAALSTDDYVKAGGFSYADETIDEMLSFLRQQQQRGSDEIIRTSEVEPFQLQLLCLHIEERVRAAKSTTLGYVVKPADLGGQQGMKRVLQRFYEDRISALDSPWQRRRVHALCEKGLIDGQYRMSLEERMIQRKYFVSKPLLDRLVNSRLLRAEPRVGSIYYELSHDTLVQPILKSSRERKVRAVRSLVPFIAVILVLSFIIINKQLTATRQFNELYQEARDLVKNEKYDEAVDKYTEIVKQKRKNLDIALYIAEVGEISNQVDTGRLEEFYGEAAKKKVHLPKIYIALGDIYMQYSEFDIAYSKYDEVLKHFEEPVNLEEDEIDWYQKTAYTRMAIARINDDEPDEAVKIYKEAVNSGSQFAGINKEIAREMKQRGMKIELEALLDVAASVGGEMSFSYYENLGRNYAYLDKHKKAIKFYNKAIELNSKGAAAYKGKAISYIYDNKAFNAIEVYQKADLKNRVPLYGDISWALKQEKQDRALKRLLTFAARGEFQKPLYYENFGYDFFYLGNFKKAVEFYRLAKQKAKEKGAERASIYKGLAISLVYAGHPGEAITEYRNAVSGNPGKPEFVSVYGDIAQAMRENGKFNELQALMEAASGYSCTFSTYYQNLGRDYLYFGEISKAIQYYKMAREKDEKNMEAAKGLAIAYVLDGDYSLAIKVFADAVEKNPDAVSIYGDIAEKMKKENQKTTLEKLLKKAADIDSRFENSDDPVEDSSFYESLGRDYRYFDDFTNALKYYKKALKIDSSVKTIYLGLIDVHIKRKKPGHALAVYKKAVSVNPGFASMYVDIYRSFRKNGMASDVVDLLTIAAGVDGQEAKYYISLATRLKGKKKYDKAIRCYRKAIKVDPENVSAYRALAQIYHKNLNNFPEALKVYKEALTRTPDAANIYKGFVIQLRQTPMTEGASRDDRMESLLAVASGVEDQEASYYEGLGNNYLIYLKMFDKAITLYQKAIRLDPRGKTVYNRLAAAYGLKGNYQKAIENYKKALSLKPGSLIIKINIAKTEFFGRNYREAAKHAYQALTFETARVWDKVAARFVLACVALMNRQNEEAAKQLKTLADLYLTMGRSQPYSFMGLYQFKNYKPILQATPLKEAYKTILFKLIDILDNRRKSGRSKVNAFVREVETVIQ